jgi:multiple sugar transport system substrate-binding protein
MEFQAHLQSHWLQLFPLSTHEVVMKNLMRFALTLTVAWSFLTGQVVAQSETILKYMAWSDSELELEQPMIAAFEAANPGVKVESSAMPPKDYWPRLSALAAAGDLPDVFWMSSGFIQSWQADGQIDNIADKVSGIKEAEWYGGAISVARLAGGVYSFPKNWVAPVLYYNTKMFDAAGLEYPNSNWRYDDFLKAAKALTLDTNNDGTPDQYGYWVYGRYAHIEPWVFRNGGRLLNADRTKLEPNAAALEALQFVTDLANVHGVAPKPEMMDGIRQQDVFPMGMAAMWVDGSWNIDGVRKTAGPDFSFGISQIPMGPSVSKGNAVGYAWSDMMAVAPTSKQRDLSWKFIEHMTGPGNKVENFGGGKVPAYRPIAESEAWLERDQYPKNKEVILEIGLGQTTTSFTPNWSKWRGYAASAGGGMNGELDEVLNGRKRLQEAVDAFVEYGNSVLAGN